VLTDEARAALRRARAAWRRLPVARRPSLALPESALGLFDAQGLVALAKCGAWPLPPRALRWLAAPPRRAREERLWQDLLALAKRSPKRLRQLIRHLQSPAPNGVRNHAARLQP